MSYNTGIQTFLNVIEKSKEYFVKEQLEEINRMNTYLETINTTINHLDISTFSDNNINIFQDCYYYLIKYKYIFKYNLDDEYKKENDWYEIKDYKINFFSNDNNSTINLYTIEYLNKYLNDAILYLQNINNQFKTNYGITLIDEKKNYFKIDNEMFIRKIEHAWNSDDFYTSLYTSTDSTPESSPNMYLINGSFNDEFEALNQDKSFYNVLQVHRSLRIDASRIESGIRINNNEYTQFIISIMDKYYAPIIEPNSNQSLLKKLRNSFKKKKTHEEFLVKMFSLRLETDTTLDDLHQIFRHTLLYHYHPEKIKNIVSTLRIDSLTTVIYELVKKKIIQMYKKFKFIKKYKESNQQVSQTDISYSSTDSSEQVSSLDYIRELFNINRGYKRLDTKEKKEGGFKKYKNISKKNQNGFKKYKNISKKCIRKNLIKA